MHREGNSVITSFAEHPVCGNFKMYSILFLVFYILICYYQTKKHLFKSLCLEFQVLHEGSSDFTLFVQHPVYSNSKLYSILFLVLLFYFASINPKCMCKSVFFLKFQVLHEGRSVITSLVEHPVWQFRNV